MFKPIKVAGLNTFIISEGVEFVYKGDTVRWVWPWRRKEGKPFLSLGLCRRFKTLEDIDRAWEETSFPLKKEAI